MIRTPVNQVLEILGLGVLNNTQYANTYQLDVVRDQMNLIILVDEALTRLYSRFNLRTRNVLIEVQVGRTFYHLDSKYAVQSHDPILVPHPYIKDLPNDKFEDDACKVLQIQDSLGRTRPLNDPNRTDSLYTPQPDVIQNPQPVPLDIMFVTYQAKHPKIAVKAEVDGDVAWQYGHDVILPDVLMPALYNYVGYLVYSRMATQEANAKAAGNLMVYEEICKDVERGDLVNNSQSCSNIRFGLNGWQ